MFPNLHLLGELDCWWSGAEPTETLVRLKTFLGDHRNITLTLASSTPLMACLESLATVGDGQLPDRVIAEGGLAIFHARNDGSLGRVVVNGDLLEVVPKVIGYQTAATHLHRHFASATPLMACARTEPFLEVLQMADYPVFLPGGELGHSAPDLPRSKGSLSPSMNSNGILDALLRLQSEPRLLQL